MISPKRLKNVSIQTKMSGVTILANLLIFIVNVVLLISINDISNKMDSVYKDNIFLNQVTQTLNSVQYSMTDYLNTKTSDSLEAFYRNEQEYSIVIQELKGEISSSQFSRMQRTIREMSEKYLAEVDQTIDAKRGRNVEKYRVRYENATKLYGYISTYVNSLNNGQLIENSKSYGTMLNAFRRFGTIVNLITVFVILGDVLITAQLTKTIVSPLKRLTVTAEEVAGGNFDVEQLPITSEDEIGVVTGTFNQMIVSIQESIEQLKKSAAIEQQLRENELLMATHLKDAQLRYLQAQINPHFLFNTLNAGAQLAMMEGADKTYDYVQRVAEFFRYNVKKSSQTVTLGEEVDLVDTYIYILNVRFSGDIKYEARIDKSLLDIEMPSMILQPIVENCVNHGIKEMMGEGRIELDVYRIDDVACVSVKDNGVGMTQDMIDRIMHGNSREKQEGSQSNGIGMDNVVGRLKLFTGDEDCFSIVSEGEGRGTMFNMYLGLHRKQY